MVSLLVLDCLNKASVVSGILYSGVSAGAIAVFSSVGGSLPLVLLTQPVHNVLSNWGAGGWFVAEIWRSSPSGARLPEDWGVLPAQGSTEGRIGGSIHTVYTSGKSPMVI